MWVVYFFVFLFLICEFVFESEFYGVIRIIVVLVCEEGEDDEVLFDRYCDCYLIGGYVDFFENCEVIYKWEM